MKPLNLLLHCGGYRADLQQVEAVPTPEPVQRWTPIPHALVHRSVTEAIAHLGLEIVQQVHALARGGNHYFGLYQIAKPNAEMGLVIGTRNSHDKTFVAGIAAGEGVFACDNLSFWSEVVLGRKHTSNIVRDLPGVCQKAVGMLAEKWTDTESRVAVYRERRLEAPQVHDFVVRSLDAGVVTASQVPHVLKEWRTPSHTEFTENGSTAWRLYNAYTDCFKTLGNPATLVRRSQVLTGMLDAELGLLARN